MLLPALTAHDHRYSGMALAWLAARLAAAFSAAHVSICTTVSCGIGYSQAVHPYAPAGKLEMMRSLAFPEKPKVVVGRRELPVA